MPKIKINGKDLDVAEGTSVIEAFKKADVHIAHYCWHPGLSVAGCCRMCMVDIEGNPKLQIACNTTVKDGMVVSNQTEKVKESVKWVLDFHLINHPLDCPICDQAGECGLQDQYMEFGKYEPEMGQRKVKKRKVIDLGERVVLDSERCILCSRCVRFTDEVTKTFELGIFHRGDHSEIGTVADKPLNNNYSINTVDICPVGALTSKDFRFRQRVWLLKDKDSICPGCSTGCNVKAYFNAEGVFRLKPVYNEKINGHWMCDKGRDAYKFVNKEVRLAKAIHNDNGIIAEMIPGAAAKQVAENIKSIDKKSVALVLTAQYTSEEIEGTIHSLKDTVDKENIFYWINNKDSFDEFDGLLYRGDKNPNTKGLLKILSNEKIQGTWSQLEEKLSSGKIDTLIVAGPENQVVYPDLEKQLKIFEKAKQVVWLTACPVGSLKNVLGSWQNPLKTFLEKSGTFVNVNGVEQKIKRAMTIISEALTLNEAAALIGGGDISVEASYETEAPIKPRVKNEFVHTRGEL